MGLKNKVVIMNSFILFIIGYLSIGLMAGVQMSPKKALRVAMLKSRFADTIFKATHPALVCTLYILSSTQYCILGWYAEYCVFLYWSSMRKP